jgi:hypothetical protein
MLHSRVSILRRSEEFPNPINTRTKIYPTDPAPHLHSPQRFRGEQLATCKPIRERCS